MKRVAVLGRLRGADLELQGRVKPILKGDLSQGAAGEHSLKRTQRAAWGGKAAPAHTCPQTALGSQAWWTPGPAWRSTH